MPKILEGHDFTISLHTFDKDDFKRMAGALGVEALSTHQQSALQRARLIYLALATSWEQSPRPASVRKLLKAVHTDAFRLMKTIHSLHDIEVPDRPARQTTLALLHSAAPGNDWGEIDNDLMAFAQRLADVGKASNDAISDLPADKGGVPGDFPLKMLVLRLADLFREITGETPTCFPDHYAETGAEYRGGFFSFIEAFLRPLGSMPERSHQGLGKFVQRTLGHSRS